MTDQPDEELTELLQDPRIVAYVEENLPALRRLDQRLLYWSLLVGFLVGLAAHVIGYLLRPSATSEPFGLLADLLYGLGFSLWTGVVVAVLVQVFPEAKRRQMEAFLKAYEVERATWSSRPNRGSEDERG